MAARVGADGSVLAAEAGARDRAPRRTSNLLDVVAQFASSVFGRGLYLLMQVVLARTLGPKGFGLYAIGWTVCGFLSTLTAVGMPQAVMRYRMGGRGLLASNAMAVTVVVGTVSGAALAAASGLIATRMFATPAAAPVILAFATSVPLLGVFSVAMSALRSSGAMVLSAAAGALLFAAYLGLTVSVFLTAPTPALAAQLYAVAIVIAILPAGLFLWRTGSIGSAPPLGPLLRFGIVTMFIHSANVLNLWADRVVIGVMADAVAVGVYQVASQLAMISIVLRSAVTTVFESSVARAGGDGRVSGADGHIPDLTRAFFAACRILLHISAPGLVVLAVTAGFWIHLLFGPAYAAATAPLLILTIGQILVTFLGPSVTALHMSGAERLVMALSVGSCVLNIVGNIVLIPYLGSSGAALASAVANFAVAFICLAFGIRSGRIGFAFIWLRDVVLALAVCAGACLLAAHLLAPLSIAKAALVLVLAYALYAATIALSCAVEDELLDKARQLGLRLRYRSAR